MTALRIWLIVIMTVLGSYTVVVIANHGLALFPIFFGDIATMGWPGQFNLDFMFMLTLSALWTAWRNGFSAMGLLLGFLAFNFGAMFLSIYLLTLTLQTRGDMRAVMLGVNGG